MTTQANPRHVPEWTAADRLRRVRREVGLSQKDFAARMGIGSQRYSAWEAGRNQPPMVEFVELAKRIESLTGIAAEWTLGLITEAPQPNGPGGLSVLPLHARRESNSQPSDPNVLPLQRSA